MVRGTWMVTVSQILTIYITSIWYFIFFYFYLHFYILNNFYWSIVNVVKFLPYSKVNQLYLNINPLFRAEQKIGVG